MAQNITLLGASYSAVPAVRLPKTGGGTADFTDVSDTTAAAADVASGKYFYTAAGVRTQGTNQGGGSTLGTKTITSNGEYDAQDDGYDGYSSVDVQVPGSSPTLQAKTNIAPTTSSQTITADQGYDGLSSVQINAMPTGTAGTPTATKGAVSNHSISVTPSVTNSAGYIASGTINGTAVSVSASELDSGTKSITANGNSQDVVGYASVNVNVPNSYSASDEGKVVSSGALVSQTAHADVTPTTSDQTIDTTTNNSIKVKGDADLVAGNIKKDVEIFGVTGSYEGGGGDTVGEYLTNTLTQYENENITTVPMTYAFSGCTSLTSLKMPNLTSSNAYLVNGCSGLTILVFPKLATFSGWQIFAGAKNLHTIDILGPSTFQQQVFSGDSKLNTLILRRQTLITMANINTFNNTCFASGKSGGTLYVPSALVSSYQSASNWSTILGYANNQIKSIESTHTDPTAPIDLTLYYADGTPIS